MKRYLLHLAVFLILFLFACSSSQELMPDLPWVEGEISGISEYLFVSVGNYVADYEKLPVKPEELSALVGETYDTDSFILNNDHIEPIDGVLYQLIGCDNKKYLILCDTNQNHSVWQFRCFRTANQKMQEQFPAAEFPETYLYAEVLSLIYGVKSSDDIVAITITADDYDRTPEGKKIGDLIGTDRLSKRRHINTIYNILATMSCYGSNTDKKVMGTPRTDLSLQTEIDYAMPGEMWLRRELTLELEDGTTVAGMKYTAVWGAFFEQNSLWYAPLKETDMEWIHSLFCMDPKEIADHSEVQT